MDKKKEIFLDPTEARLFMKLGAMTGIVDNIIQQIENFPMSWFEQVKEAHKILAPLSIVDANAYLEILDLLIKIKKLATQLRSAFKITTKINQN